MSTDSEELKSRRRADRGEGNQIGKRGGGDGGEL